MWKLIIDIWRSRRFERRIYGEFVEMLEMDHEMFDIVAQVLAGKVAADHVQDDLLRRDIEVNRKERSIRRQIVERMSTNKGGTVTTSLVLMSVVKDAERVGDYCKNLLEVAQILKQPLQELTHAQEVVDITEHVREIFRQSILAFANEDEDVAREIIQDEGLMNKRCDRLVESIARSSLDANESVCTALLVRFMKRIEAHLSNICSSLVLPVHRIDYRLKYVKKADGTVEQQLDGDDLPEGEEP